MITVLHETEASPALWGGKTLDERRQLRRGALIEAGLDAFATEGYPNSSITRICKASRVSERYLYEEFGGKEELLLAVYDGLIQHVFKAVAGALTDTSLPVEEQIRRAADAFTLSLTSDPRRARVNFLEVVGAGPKVEARRREVLERFGQMIHAQWQLAHRAGQVSGTPDHGLAMALVGATQELLVDWIHGGRKRRRRQIVATLVKLYLAVMRA